MKRTIVKKTIENYRRYLTRFFQDTKVQVPADICETTVEQFFSTLAQKKNMQTGKTLSAKTVNYYRIALRSFLTYLETQNIPCVSAKQVPLEHIGHEIMRETLNETECERVYQHSDNKNIKQLRDRAIVLLLLSTGIRVSELCALNSDIDISNSTLILKSSCGTYRELALPQETKEALQVYLYTRKDTAQPLFVNNGKRVSDHGSIRLTARSVQRIVKQYTSCIGISRNITPQMLRRTYAHVLEKNGADSVLLQDRLGLEHIASVHTYTHKEEK